MRIMSLDLGDSWIGTALSDPLRFFSKPYKTVPAQDLETFLSVTIPLERVSEIVVGYPKTMQGTESDQTRLVIETKNKLEILFPTIKWILWDERLTSKQARKIRSPKNKEEKLAQHSIAAAIILESYLPFSNKSIC